MWQAREALAQEYLTSGSLRGRQVPLLVRLEDDNLTATSSALGIISTQVSAVF